MMAITIRVWARSKRLPGSIERITFAYAGNRSGIVGARANWMARFSVASATSEWNSMSASVSASASDITASVFSRFCSSRFAILGVQRSAARPAIPGSSAISNSHSSRNVIPCSTSASDCDVCRDSWLGRTTRSRRCLPRFDEPRVLQRPDRLSYCLACDAQLVGEVLLCGQVAPLGNFAA